MSSVRTHQLFRRVERHPRFQALAPEQKLKFMDFLGERARQRATNPEEFSATWGRIRDRVRREAFPDDNKGEGQRAQSLRSLRPRKGSTFGGRVEKAFKDRIKAIAQNRFSYDDLKQALDEEYAAEVENGPDPNQPGLVSGLIGSAAPTLGAAFGASVATTPIGGLAAAGGVEALASRIESTRDSYFSLLDAGENPEVAFAKAVQVGLGSGAIQGTAAAVPLGGPLASKAAKRLAGASTGAARFGLETAAHGAVNAVENAAAEAVDIAQERAQGVDLTERRGGVAQRLALNAAVGAGITGAVSVGRKLREGNFDAETEAGRLAAVARLRELREKDRQAAKELEDDFKRGLFKDSPDPNKEIDEYEAILDALTDGRDADVDLNVTGAEGPDALAVWRKAAKEIEFFSQALEGTEATKVRTATHEMAHAFHDTLDPKTQASLFQVFREEMANRTGPLFDKEGNLRPGVDPQVEQAVALAAEATTREQAGAAIERAYREWFAERVMLDNHDWAMGRVAGDKKTGVGRVAEKFRRRLERLGRALGFGNDLQNRFRDMFDRERKAVDRSGSTVRALAQDVAEQLIPAPNVLTREPPRPALPPPKFELSPRYRQPVEHTEVSFDAPIRRHVPVEGGTAETFDTPVRRREFVDFRSGPTFDVPVSVRPVPADVQRLRNALAPPKVGSSEPKGQAVEDRKAALLGELAQRFPRQNEKLLAEAVRRANTHRALDELVRRAEAAEARLKGRPQDRSQDQPADRSQDRKRPGRFASLARTPKFDSAEEQKVFGRYDSGEEIQVGDIVKVPVRTQVPSGKAATRVKTFRKRADAVVVGFDGHQPVVQITRDDNHVWRPGDMVNAGSGLRFRARGDAVAVDEIEAVQARVDQDVREGRSLSYWAVNNPDSLLAEIHKQVEAKKKALGEKDFDDLDLFSRRGKLEQKEVEALSEFHELPQKRRDFIWETLSEPNGEYLGAQSVSGHLFEQQTGLRMRVAIDDADMLAINVIDPKRNKTIASLDAVLADNDPFPNVFVELAEILDSDFLREYQVWKALRKFEGDEKAAAEWLLSLPESERYSRARPEDFSPEHWSYGHYVDHMRKVVRKTADDFKLDPTQDRVSPGVALYSELATIAQTFAVPRILGSVVGGGALGVRQKLFPGTRDTRTGETGEELRRRAEELNHEGGLSGFGPALKLESPIDPDRVYSRRSLSRRAAQWKQKHLSDAPEALVDSYDLMTRRGHLLPEEVDLLGDLDSLLEDRKEHIRKTLERWDVSQESTVDFDEPLSTAGELFEEQTGLTIRTSVDEDDISVIIRRNGQLAASLAATLESDFDSVYVDLTRTHDGQLLREFHVWKALRKAKGDRLKAAQLLLTWPESRKYMRFLPLDVDPMDPSYYDYVLETADAIDEAVDELGIDPDEDRITVGVALYSELATLMQALNRSRLVGSVVGGGALGLRQKLFPDTAAATGERGDALRALVAELNESGGLDHNVFGIPVKTVSKVEPDVLYSGRHRVRRFAERGASRDRRLRSVFGSRPDIAFRKPQNIRDIQRDAAVKTDAELEDSLKALEDRTEPSELNTFVLDGLEALRRGLAKDDEAAYTRAYEVLSKAGTTIGQMLRQFREFKGVGAKRNLVRLVELTLARAGRKLTPKQALRLQALVTHDLAARDELEAAAEHYFSNPADKDAEKKAFDAAYREDRSFRALQAHVRSLLPRSAAQFPTDFLSTIQGNLLTPISTMRNLEGNYINYALRLPARLPAAVLDLAVSKFTKDRSRTVKAPSFRELGWFLEGTKRGLPKARDAFLLGSKYDTIVGETVRGFNPVKALISAFTGDLPVDAKTGKVRVSDRLRKLVEGVFGMAPEAMLRTLSSMDELAKEGFRSARLEEEVRLRGLRPGTREFAEVRFSGAATPHPVREFPGDRKAAAVAEASALQQTFQDRSGAAKVAQAVEHAMESLPVIGPSLRVAYRVAVSPYVRTPVNLTLEGMKFAVPLFGFAHGAVKAMQGNRRESALSFGYAVTGMMMGALADSLLAEGLVSPGPENNKTSRVVSDSGMGFFRLNVSGLRRRLNGESADFRPGDYTIRLDTLGVLGYVMAVRAEGQRLAEKTPKAVESLPKVAADQLGSLMAAGRFAMNQTMLQGAADGIRALADGEGSAARWVRNFVNVVSAAAMPNTLLAWNNIHEDTRKETLDKDSPYRSALNVLRHKAGVLEAIATERHSLLDSLPDRLDMWGRPQKATPEGQNPFVWNMLDVFKTQQAKDDASTIIYRLVRATGNADFVPTMVPRTLTHNRTPLNLPPEDYASLVRDVQGAKLEAFHRTFNLPAWRRLAETNPDVAAQQLQNAYTKAGRVAKAKWIAANRRRLNSLAAELAASQRHRR